MRRLQHIVPFTHKPKAPDPGLERKLRGEAPSILRWMIEGAQIYRREGLKPPPSVTQATDQVFAENDVLGRWLDQECMAVPGSTSIWAPSSELYTGFARFAEANGEKPGSSTAFGNALRQRGFENKKMRVGSKSVRVWLGIQLLV